MGWWFKASLSQVKSEILFGKKNQKLKAKGLRSLAQVVKYFPCKQEALSSFPKCWGKKTEQEKKLLVYGMYADLFLSLFRKQFNVTTISIAFTLC